jgi:hypothetical protein
VRGHSVVSQCCRFSSVLCSPSPSSAGHAPVGVASDSEQVIDGDARLALLMIAGCANNGSSSATSSEHYNKGSCLITNRIEKCTGPEGPVIATGFITKTVWQPAQAREACEMLEEVFGLVPTSELHLLPIGGAIALPGCLLGQIP